MKNPDISSLEHTSWRCQYHVVFAPKYRRMEIYREIRADIGVILRNGVVPVSMGIPMIGFGPGEYKLAHMTNEHCAVQKVKDACSFYVNLISLL